MLPSRPPSSRFVLSPRPPSGLREGQTIRPRAIPLLPFLAANLVFLTIILLTAWWYQARQPAPTQTTQASAANTNPFTALVELRQRHAQAKDLAKREPRRVTLPTTAPLQVLGTPQGRVTLTLLVDPASLSSRRQLAEWLELSLPNVRVELRFAPSGDSLSGGVVLQLAQRFGKAPLLWQALQEQRENLTDTDLLNLLAERDIPFLDLRVALADPNSPLLQDAQAAADWAKRNSLTPPLALIDGLVVDGDVLHPELIPIYLQRRAAGTEMIQAKDYLLMNK